jgi:hypothetical protein
VEQGELGYPLCLADGDSRSPLASQAELQNFDETKQKFGLRTDRVGFYADVVVDALLLQDLDGREQGWSVLEALRMGMSQVLDMEIDDLQLQVLGRAGSSQVDGLLYDPMPGGSGLLEQALERFGEVHAAAMKIVRGCAGQCERSCIDCLQTFRNSFYHAHLDRHAAVELLELLGPAIERGHEVAAKLPQAPATGKEMPVNAAEARLKLLLERAQLPTGIWHETLRLGHPIGSTSPDVFYELDDLCPGVCIYLDGLSRHVHGNSETAERDRLIRTELRTKGYEVIEIPATHLHDPESMRRYFMRVADRLSGREAARRIRDDGAWFVAG